ncbi:MAG: hypothetical protein LBI38_01315, partial [Oscillospiraceae bacterium]|nr:hypothetical protein [Oscillospiraceae bacterium]
MDSKDAFEKSALRPTRISVVLYSVVKQLLFTVFEPGNAWVGRLIISAVWVSVVFLATGSKKLTRRQITFAVLITTVIQEIVFYAAVGGDRFIYTFLVGCSLLSVMYADTNAMKLTMLLSCLSVFFCVFILGVNTVGLEYVFMDDVYNLVGLIMINAVIFLIAKYTIGTLAESRREAEESTRAKSEFLAMMSHEIRTPLNAILGIAQIQMQKRDASGESGEAFERICNSGNTLLGIINDILDMAKIESGKLE